VCVSPVRLSVCPVFAPNSKQKCIIELKMGVSVTQGRSQQLPDSSSKGQSQGHRASETQKWCIFCVHVFLRLADYAPTDSISSGALGGCSATRRMAAYVSSPGADVFARYESADVVVGTCDVCCFDVAEDARLLWLDQTSCPFSSLWFILTTKINNILHAWVALLSQNVTIVKFSSTVWFVV